MSKSILIGVPSGSGYIHIQMVQSLLGLHKPAPCGFVTVERQRIDKARNYIAQQALRGNFDYLFFVDDDNPIPDNTLEVFLEDDKDIVSAPILSRNVNADGSRDLCSFYKREVEVDGKPLDLYEHIKQFKDDGPMHRVDGTGTGCVLIKIEVIRKLHELYPDGIFEFGDIKFKKPIIVDGVEYKRRTMSEDMEFCERATKAGYEIWVDDRIRPLHFTSMGGVQWRT